LAGIVVLIVVIAAMVLLDIAAITHGVDSRDGRPDGRRR
jgi:hypothetical protein